MRLVGGLATRLARGSMAVTTHFPHSALSSRLSPHCGSRPRLELCLPPTFGRITPRPAAGGGAFHALNRSSLASRMPHSAIAAAAVSASAASGTAADSAKDEADHGRLEHQLPIGTPIFYQMLKASRYEEDRRDMEVPKSLFALLWGQVAGRGESRYKKSRAAGGEEGGADVRVMPGVTLRVMVDGQEVEGVPQVTCDLRANLGATRTMLNIPSARGLLPYLTGKYNRGYLGHVGCPQLMLVVTSGKGDDLQLGTESWEPGTQVYNPYHGLQPLEAALVGSARARKKQQQRAAALAAAPGAPPSPPPPGGAVVTSTWLAASQQQAGLLLSEVTTQEMPGNVRRVCTCTPTQVRQESSLLVPAGVVGALFPDVWTRLTHGSHPQDAVVQQVYLFGQHLPLQPPTPHTVILSRHTSKVTEEGGSSSSSGSGSDDPEAPDLGSPSPAHGTAGDAATSGGGPHQQPSRGGGGGGGASAPAGPVGPLKMTLTGGAAQIKGDVVVEWRREMCEGGVLHMYLCTQ